MAGFLVLLALIWYNTSLKHTPRPGGARRSPLDRKQVLIPQEQLARQREFEEKIRALHEGRAAPLLAMVDTFSCQ